ncbi:hypothetical protein GIB67_039142 [Kingdonia uniflora]|uniref:Uncharacterized protein n=1 Tax=Kingdonia uniflora TaxID=39325 RepID=A0A7J7MLR5_9MAGN|nr:hypothetical protein GIB67_039142 [Kingdonia uniflora]
MSLSSCVALSSEHNSSIYAKLLSEIKARIEEWMMIRNGCEAISDNIKYKEARGRVTNVGLTKIEQFGDVDFNDESAPQRNDLGFGSAEEALGAQSTEGDPMNEDNVEAPPMSDPPQTKVSQKHKETAAPINDTYPPDRSLLLSFKFHRARSIYLGQEPGCFRVHHHAPTWNLLRNQQLFETWLYLLV